MQGAGCSGAALPREARRISEADRERIAERVRVENAVTELDDDELDRMIEMLRERALAARQEQALELKPEPKALPNGRH